MDWAYISDECKKLGISDFEKQSRNLSQKISGNSCEELSDEDKIMLEYYLKSGTYGTMEHLSQKKIEKFNEKTGSTSRLKYIRYRIFPPMEIYEIYFPFFYRHKILLPVGWAYRIIRGVTARRKKLKSELKYLHNYDNNKIKK